MSRRPNVVLVTLDSWRHDALGVAPDHRGLVRHGLDGAPSTPNLDAFAAGSLHFTAARSPAPGTTNAHASLMTGLYPTAHGVRAFMSQRLAPHVRTLAECLTEQGYATVTTHEVEEAEALGTGLLFGSGVDALRGFEEVVRDDAGLLASDAVRGERPVFAFLHLWDLHEPYLHSACEAIPDRHAPLEARLADLERRYGVPLTDAPDLTAAHLTPRIRHLEASIEDTATHNRELFRWYVEGLEHFDRHRWPLLVDTLRRAGLWEDTLLFVFGDHGEGPIEDPLGAGKRFGHGLPLLEDRLRVPLLVRGLSGFEPGQVGAAVSLVDVAPTVLRELGVDPAHPNPGAQVLQRGVALHERLSGAAPEPVSFAEGFTDAPRTGESLLVQRVAVRGRHKLWCHDGEAAQARFRRPGAGARRLARRVLGRIRPAWRNRVVDERRVDPKRLFWVDLAADPFERRPHRYSREAPAEVHALREALEALYARAVYGPPRRSDEGGQDEDLHRRLAALGYVES